MAGFLGGGIQNESSEEKEFSKELTIVRKQAALERGQPTGGGLNGGYAAWGLLAARRPNGATHS
jgi:hypothetical protein